jgi:hypothetical protein
MAPMTATSKYRGFLPSLLMPDEHRTRFATIPILRVDAFGLWGSYFHAVIQEKNVSIHTIRQILEHRKPESPLEIALRVRENSPSIYQAMVTMGAYSDKDIDDWIGRNIARDSSWGLHIAPYK